MNYDIMKLWLQSLAFEWLNVPYLGDGGIRIYTLEYNNVGLSTVELNAKLNLGDLKITLTYDGEPEETREIKLFITGENEFAQNTVDQIVFLPVNSIGSNKKARKILKKTVYTAITELCSH